MKALFVSSGLSQYSRNTEAPLTSSSPSFSSNPGVTCRREERHAGQSRAVLGSPLLLYPLWTQVGGFQLHHRSNGAFGFWFYCFVLGFIFLKPDSWKSLKLTTFNGWTSVTHKPGLLLCPCPEVEASVRPLLKTVSESHFCILLRSCETFTSTTQAAGGWQHPGIAAGGWQHPGTASGQQQLCSE